MHRGAWQKLLSSINFPEIFIVTNQGLLPGIIKFWFWLRKLSLLVLWMNWK